MSINKDDWKRILISPQESVMAAVEKIDKEALRVVLVVDSENTLLGVVTDGDIRRYLLKHGDFNAPVCTIMNKNPKLAYEMENKEQLIIKLQNLNILHLPIVNEKKQVVGFETLDHLVARKKCDNWVIFMAGGLGTRLHPLTLEFPKPLVKIGNKPILEILLENFTNQGFKNFYFIVNYKASMIQEYFGQGEKWGANIVYVHENEALGTVGGLHLLSQKPTQPFFIMNADIVTNINFNQILDFHTHHTQNPIATLCVRPYQNTIPYGVVRLHDFDHSVIDIEEKPTHSYFINAGIYVFNPEALNYFSRKIERYDMPSFLHELLRNKQFVSTFPIREYWLDVGNHHNLSQAVDDYERMFV